MSAENLKLYNAVRNPPKEARRAIQAGRLKGKTDINPMWRIKTMTEQFGPCGEGWKYEIVRFWTEAGAGGEVAAFAQINLFYRQDEKWSEAVPGIGGSAFIAKERSGLYTSDECYKMALTDAISVACKALGVGADVYWDADASKYTRLVPVCEACGAEIQPANGRDVHWIAQYTRQKYGRALCSECATGLANKARDENPA